MSDPHLKTDNFLKEYDTPYEKFKVRRWNISSCKQDNTSDYGKLSRQ